MHRWYSYIVHCLYYVAVDAIICTLGITVTSTANKERVGLKFLDTYGQPDDYSIANTQPESPKIMKANF
jgi:hypothetical protein